MKTVHKIHTGDQDCSCMSCSYKGASENPSLKHFIAHGSRIDRLYYGKYIPLRERKLLERLVRTRAVYDDIRARLLSDSTLSLSTKADHKPKKKLSRELDDVEKGSAAIFELVDLVDKGATLGQCCSCCSCTSKTMRGNVRHIQHKVHGAERRMFKEERTAAIHRRRKGVRFKTKHISSDPCTCARKLSGLLKHHATEIFKRKQAPGSIEIHTTTDEDRKNKKRRVRELVHRSYENVKQMNKEMEQKFLEGVKKVKESKTKIQENLRLDTQQSAVELKQAQKRLKSKVREEKTKKSSLSSLQLNDLLAICMCPEDQIFESPHKESTLTVYTKKSKENLSVYAKKSKEKLSVYAKKSKEKLMEATGKLKSIVKSTVERKPKVRKITMKSSKTQYAPEKDLAVQKKQRSVICICPEDQIFEKPHKAKVDRKPKVRKIATKSSATHFAPEKELAFQLKKDSLIKFKEDLRRKELIKEWACDPECIEGTCVPEECLIKIERRRKNRGVKHRGIEYQQMRHEKKAGPVLHRRNVKVQDEVMVQKATGKQKPILRTQQTGELIAPLASHERVNEKRKHKKLVKREMIDEKRQQKNIKSSEKKPSSRQGVRVSSSFSFNIQFFKQTPDISKANLKESVAKQSPSGINYRIIKNPKEFHDQGISPTVTKHSSRDSQTRIRSLKRCFCTLKLKSKTKNKKRNKVMTVEKSMHTFDSSLSPCHHVNCSTEMCESLLCEKLLMTTSNTQTYTVKRNKKKKLIKPRQLLPYECEPGVCTPGECDPYHCIQLINMREAKARMRSVPCTTCPSRKIKSTSTFTSKSNKPSNAKFVQSMYSYNAAQIGNQGKLKLERKNIPHAHGRQAVRIGSTFSFNIEFYKNKPEEYVSRPSDLKTLSIKPKSKPIPKKKTKERAYQGDTRIFHRNIPTQMYREEKDASMSTTLKRCFCTLKLQKQRKDHLKNKRNKMLTTGTKTIDEVYLNKKTLDKGTKTKRKYIKTLKPYECEPFTCIPGECNPYECLERINRRHLRDVGVSSFRRSDIDKGSSTSEKSFRSAITQSKPKSKQKKVVTKMKKTKQVPKANMKSFENYSNYSSSARSRQAVKVGSTFSFNIEFYKNKPDKELITNYQSRPAIKLDTRPDTRNQGVKIEKRNVANLDTQVEFRKHNKSSTARPLLKRCFCTLNLQKRKGFVPPKVYTVNRAMIEEKRCSILNQYRNKLLSFSRSAKLNEINHSHQSNCIIKSLSKCKAVSSIEKTSCKKCYSMITNVHKQETLKIISQTYLFQEDLKFSEVPLEKFVKANNNLKRYFSQDNPESISYPSKNDKSQVSALKGSPHLKGYFCTMNLQVQTNNMPIRKQKNINSDFGNQRGNRIRKLKPYECEPGVCVPGECDPYECLKLISKRGSNFTKKTGTENTVTSESSYTNLSPKYRSYKIQSLSQKTTKPRLSVYRGQNNFGSRKAVRVGSKFSFDIEFYKNSAKPQTDLHSLISPKHVRTRPTHPRRLSKNTGINKTRYRDQSQSTFSKTFQKASATMPMMKRCFCTLKLQKKGRLLKHDFKKPTEALQTEPIPPLLMTTDRGQNTAKFKPAKVAHALEPYECMPGICLPGQCNPYECLEIMKRLNRNQTADFGIDAIRPESKSIGSMSDFHNKTRAVNVKYKNATRSTSLEGRNRQRDRQAQLIKPTKQVVRIGSSFSFNIEFHKDTPLSAHPKDFISTKPSRENFRSSDFKKPYVKKKQRASETLNPKYHKKLQIKNTVQAASTMTTSFMKRCFCVLKLKKNNKNIINEIKNQNISKPEYIDKKTNTKRYKEQVLHLEPYECEPGICIPGECDPYICEKLIKRRKNLESRSSSTPRSYTRSISSNSPRSFMRNVNTQFHPKKKLGDVKKQVHTKTRFHDSNRQVVRIGSNFSFDIEFFKNKSPNYNDYHIPKPTKDEKHFERRKRKGRNTGTNRQFPKFKSQPSQVNVNKTDFAAGFNNVLKRCFCTLQLYNQRSKKHTTKKEQKPIKNVVHSKSVMTTEKNKLNLSLLEPYECEPNFCIPYECDPYKCEQRIKLRQKHLRETGMSTQQSSTQSAGSLTDPYKRSKKRTQSSTFKNKDTFKRPKSQKNIRNTHSKQCVKIGSSFSFDIEFFKNKGTVGLQLDQRPKYMKQRHSAKKFDKVNRRKRSRTQGLQSLTPLHDNQSQINNEFMKTQSTMARFSQPLKKCFCTFYLKKNKVKPNPVLPPTTINTSTETKEHGLKLQPLSKLLPYECEPNICVPGECNPLECLERIKARLKRQKDDGTSTNYLQKNKIGTSMVMPQTRNKRLQWKSLGHVQNKKIYNQLSTSKPDKQAVKIGSNFSFNIEFYKQKGLDNFETNVSEKSKPIKYTGKPLHAAQVRKVDKQISSKYDKRNRRSHGNQSSHIEQKSKSSAMEPFLKRCFCTLKLQKKPKQRNQNTIPQSTRNDIQKISKPQLLAVDKGTITKKYRNDTNLSQYECEPYTCIPGECDPYECLERIKQRYRSSRNMSTQIIKAHYPKGVYTDLANVKTKKIQSNRFSDNAVNRRTNVVEVPRFGNLFNQQAVKIGSNFSFNIEFYKELLQPKFDINQKGDDMDTKYHKNIPRIKYKTDAVMTCPMGKYQCRGSQGNNIKTENKALEIGNALKRCFCTLKFQKELNSKQSRPKIQNAQFPQVFEVRRVGVQNKYKKNVKQNFKEVNSVGTKTKAKYLRAKNTKNVKVLNPQEMEVIHPYSPSKFKNKKRKIPQHDKPVIETKIKPMKTKITNRGKRLTKKKSKRAFGQNEISSKQSLSKLKSFMCKCVQFFSNNNKAENKVIANKQLRRKSEIVYPTNNKNTKVAAKKIKINKKINKGDFDSQHNKSKGCDDNCGSRINNDKYYQVADNINEYPPTISLKIKNKDHIAKLADKKTRNAKNKSGDQKKKIKEINEQSFTKDKIAKCPHCNYTNMKEQRSQPLKVHFQDSPKIKKKDTAKKAKIRDGLTHLNKSVDQIDGHIISTKNNKYCNYCSNCGTKLNNEEIQKASGDQKPVKKNVKGPVKDNKPKIQQSPKDKNKNLVLTPKKINSTGDKIKNLFHFERPVDNICSAKGPEPPLFEMQVDSDDGGILNKDEIIDKVKKYSRKGMKKSKEKPSDKGQGKSFGKKHGKSCRCCICLGKRRKIGAVINFAAKGSSKPTGKPCVCGSSVCAEKLEKMSKQLPTVYRSRYVKPCDCGSPVCARETVKMSSITSKDKLTCICSEVRDKEKRKLSKMKKAKEDEKRAKRLKSYKKMDNVRNALRRKQNLLLEKKLNRNASDPILLAESIVDVGKLGITALTDILRCFIRSAIDPKHAYHKLKEMKNDPSLLTKYLSTGIKNTNASSTARRVRLRCLSMKGVKNVRHFMERYAITNFLLYIASNNPKHRLPKRRPRQREQIDFNCSLYMGSLRKRPFLTVYNKYPWFYPHFLSLLNVWKQFTDISLFLLAVVVWSPCIVCMEVCRAIMCCFFCTG